MDLSELVSESASIFVGKVKGKSQRWNDKGNLILTDIEFSVIEVISGNPGKKVTYTFAGGSLNGETHSISVVPHFHNSEKYIVMIDKNHEFKFSPAVGGYQGVFAESHFRNNGRNKSGSAPSVENLGFDGFKAVIRNQLAFAHGGRQKMTAGLPVDLSFSDIGKLLSKEQCACSGIRDDRRAKAGGRQAFKTYARLAQVPVSVNPRPASDSLMNGSDRRMMEEWNRYANVFDIGSGTGSWAWSNGVFDIAGFVSNAALVNTFGSGWGNSLGVTFTKTNSAGIIVEADIFLNPSSKWASSNESIPFTPHAYGIDLTLIHELGHVLGLDHDFTGLSVMNYAPQKFDGEYMLRSNDILAIQSLYPNAVYDVNDVGVYLYKASGYRYYSSAKVTRSGSEVNSVGVGDEVVVSDYTVENVGNQGSGAVELKWLLVRNYKSLEGAIELGVSQHSSLNPGASQKSSAPLVIPDGIAPGEYYLATTVIGNQDALTENNSSWLQKSISVTNPNYSGEDLGALSSASLAASNSSNSVIASAGGGGGGGGGCLMKRR